MRKLLALLLFAGLLWLLFPLVIRQGATILGEIPIYYQNLRTWLADSPSELFQRLVAYLPSSLPNIYTAIAGDQTATTSEGVAVGYVTVTARVIFTTIVILALTLYWTLDGPRIIRSLLLLIPQDRRESMNELILAMEASVGYFIVAQGLLCLSIGAMALVAYLLTRGTTFSTISRRRLIHNAGYMPEFLTVASGSTAKLTLRQ